MNTSIVGKQLELSDAIKDYVTNALGGLSVFGLDIIAAKSVLSADEKNGKKGFGVEFIIQLAGKDTVVIRHHDKDLYAAIDLAMDRAKKVLGRHHEKVATHKHSVPMISMEEHDSEDEIVPTELDVAKPVSNEEALGLFAARGTYFMVYEDLDGKTRVMYRRKDGKVGLY